MKKLTSYIISSFLIFVAIDLLAFNNKQQNNLQSLDLNPNIILSAVGDVMMGTDYPSERMLPPDNGLGLFDPALPWLNKSDINFANLEGTLFDGDIQPDGKKGGPNRFLFRTPLSMATRLKEAGFNMISLANNHAKDFGRAGYVSTKEALNQLQIPFSSKTGEVAELQIKNKIVAMIATDFYKGQRSIIKPEPIFEEIENLKKMGRLVIVSAHAGGEGTGAQYIPATDEVFLGENRGNSIKFARGAIDAGADVIIMHGPHVPRAVELYKNKLIIYSLGNFVTGLGINITGMPGFAPLIRFQISGDGDFMGGQIVSFIQKRNPQRIEIDRKAQALKLIEKMTNEQFNGGNLIFTPEGFIQKAN